MLCAALSCSALTLGRARGAVLVGQPLTLTVAVQLEPQEGASILCFDADVFYGDTRLETSQVRVKHDFLPPTQSVSVRVETSMIVDEPVVTVYLRAGCENKTTRRYVVLAEPGTELTAPITPRQNDRRPMVAPAEVVVRQQTPVVERRAASLPIRNPGKPRERVVDADVSIAALALPGIKTNPRQGPRLKLSPLDLSEEHDPTLKLSAELVFGGGEDLQKRASAAALWRSLNASPQDTLNALNRQQAMVSDLQSLQVATTKNQLSLQELALRLEKAESERYFNPLVYGLLAMLIVTGVFVALFVRLLRSQRPANVPWWRDDVADSDDARAGPVSMVFEGFNISKSAAPLAPTAAPTSERRNGEPTADSVDIDIDLDLPETVKLDQKPERASMESPIAPHRGLVDSRADGHADFAHSMTTSLRAVKTKEMLDIRQQAEFFMTLGQHDEAISMLRDSIDDSAEENPLVYLDLLRVLHTLGRQREFDLYRTEFNSLFTGRIPTYADFDNGGSGLEAYPRICETLEILWPTAESVEFIEKCLVRLPGDVSAPGVDLEAFRDLLMLHGVARRIESSADSGLMPFSVTRSATSELGSTTVDGVVGPDRVPDDLKTVSMVDVGSDDLSVDLDLSDAGDNLIDFDTDDLVPPVRTTERKPR